MPTGVADRRSVCQLPFAGGGGYPLSAALIDFSGEDGADAFINDVGGIVIGTILVDGGADADVFQNLGLAGVIDGLRAAIEARGVAIYTDVDLENARVTGDPTTLSQVLSELAAD